MGGGKSLQNIFGDGKTRVVRRGGEAKNGKERLRMGKLRGMKEKGRERKEKEMESEIHEGWVKLEDMGLSVFSMI